MRNFARLALFFSLTFDLLFAAALLLALLAAWVEFVRFIPLQGGAAANITELAWPALVAAFYIAVLLTLSYAARRSMPIPLAVIGVLVLGCALYLGVSLGLSRSGVAGVAFGAAPALQAGPGLVLSQFDNTIVLLRESGEIWGARVVALSGQPLIFQETPLGPGNTVLGLPPLPFNVAVPWFIQSLLMDFSLSAAELRGRLDQSLFYFGVYVFSLVLLLASMRFIFELSRWPLANLFLGLLAFRGILALESFLGGWEMSALIYYLFPQQFAAELIIPAAFCALAVLFMFYTLVIRVVRGRSAPDE